ncbi:MAG: helix-turn-helix domain-containing protein [Phycisphaerae bacterium]
MKKKRTFGSEAVAALREFSEDIKRGKPLTTRTYAVEVGNTIIAEPAQVQRVRADLGLSQTLFARFLGASPVTVQKWEQGQRRVPKMAGRFLAEIQRDLPYWRNRCVESVHSK